MAMINNGGNYFGKNSIQASYELGVSGILTLAKPSGLFSRLW